MKPKLYFGHPVNVYDTELETKLLKRILAAFPSCEIENPNQPIHEKGYQDYKARTGNGMDYYNVEVLPKCVGGIFLPFRDGKWGAGVFKEAQRIEELGCFILKIDWQEGIFAMDLGDEASQVLTVEETRARIRDERGNPLPY